MQLHELRFWIALVFDSVLDLLPACCQHVLSRMLQNVLQKKR
jgi:hypothetical protein